MKSTENKISKTTAPHPDMHHTNKKSQMLTHLPPMTSPNHHEDKGSSRNTLSSPQSSKRDFRRNLNNRFIEVYVGTEVFPDMDLTVVVAIYLQAVDRLYEIVFVNKHTAREITRLYVYEDELADQMKKRHAALTLAFSAHSAWAVARNAHFHFNTVSETSPQVMSLDESLKPFKPGQPKAPHKPLRRKSSGDVQTSAVRSSSSSTRRERERRKSLVPVFSPKKSPSTPAPIKEELPDTIPHPPSSANHNHHQQIALEQVQEEKHGHARQRRKSLADLHHELLGQSNEVRLSSKPASEIMLLKEFELIELLGGVVNMSEVPSCFQRNLRSSGNLIIPKTIPNPISYFRLQAGTWEPDEHTEHLQKVRRLALLKDYSLLESDISACSVHNINFFTAVILTSLYVRHKTKIDRDPELQFLLFDVDASSFFTIFDDIPSEVHDTIPTSVFPPALIAVLGWHTSLLTDDKEIAIVKTLVDSAQAMESQAHSELQHLTDRHYDHTDNVNPNSQRMRNKWQSSIATVSHNIGVRKELRSKWGSVIKQKQQELEREALLKQHGKEGKFRPLAVDKDWCHLDSALVPETIIDYRADLKNCQAHRMARKEGSKQELDKQEKLVLERKLVAFRSSLSSVSSYDED